MNMHKAAMLMRMAVDWEVIKGTFKTYGILKEDPAFTVLKYINMFSSMQNGEKIVKHEDQYIISTFMPPFPSESFYTNMMAVTEPRGIFTQQIHGKRSAPISSYLSVTHKCPNNCMYCSAKMGPAETELTTEQWIHVINDLQDMKTSIIGLTGGEPLVRDDIFHLVRAIDQRSTSMLFTSGFNLTPERARELKKSGLFSIGISLDSHDREAHNRNRRDEKAFETALTAIQNARRAGLYVMAQTVVLKENTGKDQLFKLFQLAGENGAHEVKLLEPILSGKLLTEENLDQILYDAAGRRQLIDIQHQANQVKKFPKISTFAYTESEGKYGCGAGTQHTYISANGDLYPCDFVPMSFGNVRENSVKALWEGMNEVMGIPKIGCFAQKINREVYEKAQGKLPLNKEQSTKICLHHQSDTFPRYYRDLQ